MSLTRAPETTTPESRLPAAGGAADARGGPRGPVQTDAVGRVGRRPSPFIVAVACTVALFGLLPLGYVIVTGILTGWPALSALVFRPRVGELLMNTVGLVVITVPLCAAIGVGCAWLVGRTRLPGARVFAVLLATPLAVPAFVNSYGWVSAIPSLNGLWSGVLIATLSYFPLVYLPCAAALRRLDPTVEEAAGSLGSGPGGVFLRVVLPQLRLPILGGSLLVGLHLLSEYGAFAMIRFDTFTTAIVEQYRSTFNGPAANALAGVLVLCCLFLLVGESGARGRSRYARIGSGVAKDAQRRGLGMFTPLGYLFLGGLFVLSIGVPFSSVIRWLVRGGVEVWSDGVVAEAFLQTVGYGLAGALATCLLAFPVAFLAVRHPSRLARGLESVNYLTSSLPGIVTALALVTVSIRFVQPLYQTAVLVVVTYVLMFLPRALVNLRAGLAQVPVGLEEAARSLGKHPVAAFLSVTARFFAPSALAAAALVFLGIVTELTATLLLAPNGTRTLAIQFWSKVNDIDYVGAAPYALLMIVLSLPVTYLLFARSRLAAVS
ncbi:iron ABC transporter permease [Cryobacterium adonitolivorans]|uniref:Iron ABC transporter permease n=1 Tax=Cryobacterium adonitolivorans TaxID=1259189 RepID=A0A4R8W907_9MICO|nr:iron ABC transporter permease [Cryobacterium adonitolivorans]TFC04723.1 iron ABC transporter permease [Cryobacterium adonitolivorans]